LKEIIDAKLRDWLRYRADAWNITKEIENCQGEHERQALKAASLKLLGKYARTELDLRDYPDQWDLPETLRIWRTARTPHCECALAASRHDACSALAEQFETAVNALVEYASALS
jgi:hypothetical protein